MDMPVQWLRYEYANHSGEAPRHLFAYNFALQPRRTFLLFLALILAMHAGKFVLWLRYMLNVDEPEDLVDKFTFHSLVDISMWLLVMLRCVQLTFCEHLPGVRPADPARHSLHALLASPGCGVADRRGRACPLDEDAPAPDLDAPKLGREHMVHVFCILLHKEPTEMVLNLVHHLAAMPSAAGGRVLLFGMEFPGRPEIITQLAQEKFELPGCGGETRPLADMFDRVQVSVHKLRGGERPGTGSNHSHAMQCFGRYLREQGPNKADKERLAEQVFWHKFDANVLPPRDCSLLLECEAALCDHCTGPDERRGCGMMPLVTWSAVAPDLERSVLERGVSFSITATCSATPFSVSYVGGNLGGLLVAGGVCPSLPGEDQMAFMSRRGLLPRMRQFRSYARLIKLFYPSNLDSYNFHRYNLYPKWTRWWTTQLECVAVLYWWVLFGLPVFHKHTVPGTPDRARPEGGFQRPARPLTVLWYASLGMLRFYFMSMPILFPLQVHVMLVGVRAGISEHFDRDVIKFGMLPVGCFGAACVLAVTVFHTIDTYRQYRVPGPRFCNLARITPEAHADEVGDTGASAVGQGDMAAEADVWIHTSGVKRMEWHLSSVGLPLVCGPYLSLLALQMFYEIFQHGLLNRRVLHKVTADTVARAKTCGQSRSRHIQYTQVGASLQ